MPLPGETGRWKHHVLRLSVRLFVRLFHHLLPNLWTWYFENERMIWMPIGASGLQGNSIKWSTLGVLRS